MNTYWIDPSDRKLMVKTPVAGLSSFVFLYIWDKLPYKVIRVTVEDRTYVAATESGVTIDSNYVYKVYGMVLLSSLADMSSALSGFDQIDDLLVKFN